MPLSKRQLLGEAPEVLHDRNLTLKVRVIQTIPRRLYAGLILQQLVSACLDSAAD